VPAGGEGVNGGGGGLLVIDRRAVAGGIAAGIGNVEDTPGDRRAVPSVLTGGSVFAVLTTYSVGTAFSVLAVGTVLIKRAVFYQLKSIGSAVVKFSLEVEDVGRPGRRQVAVYPHLAVVYVLYPRTCGRALDSGKPAVNAASAHYGFSVRFGDYGVQRSVRVKVGAQPRGIARFHRVENGSDGRIGRLLSGKREGETAQQGNKKASGQGAGHRQQDSAFAGRAVFPAAGLRTCLDFRSSSRSCSKL